MSEELIEAVIRELNQARCLEGRTVGNRELASRVLAAIYQSGYRAVPSEPTEAMLDATLVASDNPSARNRRRDYAGLYRTMIAATHDA